MLFNWLTPSNMSQRHLLFKYNLLVVTIELFKKEKKNYLYVGTINIVEGLS